MRLLPILAASCFVSAMSMGIFDPLIPEIARDLSADAGITKPVPGKRHGQSYPRGLAAW